MVLGLAALAFLLNGKGYVLADVPFKTLFERPCADPVGYRIGSFDERFGISRADFEGLVRDAAGVWNMNAGRKVFEYDEVHGLPVHLMYGEHQAASNLGKSIDGEQRLYEAKKSEVEAIEVRYRERMIRYNALDKTYTQDSAVYNKKVADFNASGGALPPEYERLQQEKKELQRQEATLNAVITEVNGIAKELKTTVAELNILAQETNSKVTTYNAAVGHDFDQGNYIEDEEGKRITIFEFSNRIELVRVLTHEFGHALELGHVDNPESIMYSYNVGSALTLSVEDTAELARVCGAKS